MALENLNINNLNEEGLRKLNEDTQAKLNAIEKEREVKRKIKENYVLKNVPSSFDIDQARLGRAVMHWFEDNQKPLSKGDFEALVKRSTEEVKPSKEDIYKCPYCGKFNLRVGNFGMNEYTPQYAVHCLYCDFTMKEKESSSQEAWKNFHEWLIKEGYLDKSVKYPY